LQSIETFLNQVRRVD